MSPVTVTVFIEAIHSRPIQYRICTYSVYFRVLNNKVKCILHPTECNKTDHLTDIVLCVHKFQVYERPSRTKASSKCWRCEFAESTSDN